MTKVNPLSETDFLPTHHIHSQRVTSPQAVKLTLYRIST